MALVFDMINTDGYSILHKILRTKIIQLLEICVPKSYFLSGQAELHEVGK